MCSAEKYSVVGSCTPNFRRLRRGRSRPRRPLFLIKHGFLPTYWDFESAQKIRGAPPRTAHPAGALPRTPPLAAGASWGSAPDPSQKFRMQIYYLLLGYHDRARSLNMYWNYNCDLLFWFYLDLLMLFIFSEIFTLTLWNLHRYQMKSC